MVLLTTIGNPGGKVGGGFRREDNEKYFKEHMLVSNDL